MTDGGTQHPAHDPTPPTVLDLTAEPLVESAKAAVETETIEQKREDTRKVIAVALLLGLAAVSLAWFAVGVWGDNGDVSSSKPKT